MTKKILVIDDNRDICEFISAAADHLGWECETTSTAQKFLDALKPDTTLILLDLMMPEMDGIELLRLLGKQKCRAGIVLMSGIGKRVMETADELAKVLDLYVVGHLRKPFELAELEAVMARPHQPSAARPSASAADQRMISDIDLRLAIKRNEFVLHYHPQIEIATGKVVGMEALVRWQHPEGDLIFPDDFI